jgi:NAD(P)-dependent dehydrogenase (short-subunit alcohol dehydrogenase family)
MAPSAQAPFGEAHALIFGGAKGIGRAVAAEFARRGARVSVADIDLPAAEETAAAIAAAGGRAEALACDVAQDACVRAAAQAAEARLGPVDILMNNVGVILNGHPEDIPVEEWRRVLDLNLLSGVRALDVLLPKMIARGRGHVVNTASFAGLYPYAASRLPYVASKAAVIAVSESLALYLHPKGVRVSCFCPGPVMTGIAGQMRNWTPDAPLRGPGRQYRLMSAEAAAVALADGMAAGRVIIPTDEAVWDDVRRHAASPDAFIQAKIEAFESGDLGLPGG